MIHNRPWVAPPPPPAVLAPPCLQTTARAPSDDVRASHTAATPVPDRLPYLRPPTATRLPSTTRLQLCRRPTATLPEVGEAARRQATMYADTYVPSRVVSTTTSASRLGCDDGGHERMDIFKRARFIYSASVHPYTGEIECGRP